MTSRCEYIHRQNYPELLTTRVCAFLPSLSATFTSTESTAATTESSPWWRCLKPAQSVWSSLMVSVKHNVDCSVLLPQTCHLLPAVLPPTPEGTVGDSLSSSQHPDVFVSSDGGYSWRGTLRGAHHYSILDSGGLIVAVEAQREGQVKIIKYDIE